MNICFITYTHSYEATRAIAISVRLPTGNRLKRTPNVNLLEPDAASKEKKTLEAWAPNQHVMISSRIRCVESKIFSHYDPWSV